MIYENGQFKMIYVSVGGEGTDLGMAYSNDGINWKKTPEILSSILVRFITTGAPE